MVESLILAASASSWFDRSACLAMAGRAEAQARVLDAGSQQHARGYAAYWRLLWDRWRADDVRACEAPVTAALAGESRHGASIFWRDAFARLVGSDYEGSRRSAGVGAELARRRGDAFGLLVAQFYRVWASLLGGAWGEAEQTCNESLRDAERNEHRRGRVCSRRCGRGCCARPATLTRRRRSRARGWRTRETAHFAYGELLAGLQLGLSCLECGRFSDARTELEHLDRRLAHERLLMDWSWRMPLDLGLASLALVEGRFEDARTRARTVCDAASQYGERSWLALGSLTLAEALSGGGAIDDSRSALGTACDLAGSGQVPAAALRVWAGASRLATAQGDAESASRFQIELERLAARLVQSLAADSPLARRLADANQIGFAAAVP